MNIFTIILGLVLSMQACYTKSSIDLNSIPLCATLNDEYRMFSNIWEVYNEYKTTGQLWVPVAINACPVSYTDCSIRTPVCAISRNTIYKTFKNKCVVDAEQKSTGIAWNILFHGACPLNSVEGSKTSLSSIIADDNNQALPVSQSSSSYDEGKYNSHMDGKPNGNYLKQSESLNNYPPSSNTHQLSAQHQANQECPKSQPPSSYDGSWDNSDNSHKQSNDYEPVQKCTTCQFSQTPIQTSANSENLQHSGGWKQIGVQPQDGEDSSFPNAGLSFPPVGEYSSNQQPEHLPNNPEPIKPCVNDHFYQNTVKRKTGSEQLPFYRDCNQMEVQRQNNQASLSTHSLVPNEGCSQSTVGEHNSNQKPEHFANHPESIQISGNVQFNHNPMQLPVGEYSSNQQPEHLSNNPESTQGCGNAQFNHNPMQLPTKSENLPRSEIASQFASQNQIGNAPPVADYGPVEEMKPQSISMQAWANCQSDNKNSVSAHAARDQVKEVLPSIYTSPSPNSGHHKLGQESQPLPTYLEVQAQAEQTSSESHSRSSQPITSPILIHDDYSGVHPLPTSESLGKADAKSSSYDGNTKIQTSFVPESPRLSTNSQTSDDTSLSSAINPETSNDYNNNQQYADMINEAGYSSSTAKPKTLHKEENSNQKEQNAGQTIYNGVVYQGPYYYEPKYKHIYLSSFNFRPAPGAISAPLTSEESNGAVLHGLHPFESLLKQLNYVDTQSTY